MMLLLVTLFSLFAFCVGNNVIDLDNKSFEHLTQASTGATTGDWLVKFYAPWCGHCKKMEPLYEEIATALKGEVNVARVDVPANKDLGTRFEVKGFPSLLFLSKGKVYRYKGKRTKDDIIEYVTKGYKTVEGEEIRKPLGYFAELTYIFTKAMEEAVKDIKSGDYGSSNVILAFLPFLFIIAILIIACNTPAHQYGEEPKTRRKKVD